MPATLAIIERNGPAPGIIAENVFNIDWKAVDDSFTPYAYYIATIKAGDNSFAKYHYLKFGGQFTTLGNVKITHLSGKLPNGVKLMTSPSISLDGSKLPYSTPNTEINPALTPFNLSGLGASVSLMVGPPQSNADPAYAAGKLSIADNLNGTLYSNYFISQLQVAETANLGLVGPIVLQISYDEI